MAGGAFSKFVKAQSGAAAPAAPGKSPPPFPPKKPAFGGKAAPPFGGKAAPGGKPAVDPKKCPECGKAIPTGEDECPSCNPDSEASAMDASKKPNPLMAWANKNAAKKAGG